MIIRNHFEKIIFKKDIQTGNAMLSKLYIVVTGMRKVKNIHDIRLNEDLI